MNYRRIRLPRTNDNDDSPLVAHALRYEPGTDHAPRVVASGKRIVAEQILAEARKHGITIYEDPGLTAALATVNLGDEIPVELYQVVAEVLAYVYRVSKRTSR